jgi:hypothetical protein
MVSHHSRLKSVLFWCHKLHGPTSKERHFTEPCYTLCLVRVWHCIFLLYIFLHKMGLSTIYYHSETYFELWLLEIYTKLFKEIKYIGLNQWNSKRYHIWVLNLALSNFSKVYHYAN